MTWLYIPSTCSASAPASEASNSDSNLLTAISERLSEGSAMSRGKQLQPQAWSRQWKRGGFIRRLSGATLDRSTADSLAALWISSLRATHAKAILSRESGSANSTIDGCSTAPSTSSTRRGLVLSSARTSRGTRTDSLPLPSQHWSDWAAALRSEYSARPKLAIPCAGSDCSSWPSARTSDTNGAGLHDTGTRTKRYGQGGMALSMQVTQWEAPSVAVTDGSRKTRSGDRSHELLLTGQAEKVSARWAGPAAQNHKGSSQGSSQGSITRQDGKSRADILSYQAEQFFRLPSSPDHPTIAGGALCSTDTPNANQPSVKRKLNPIFVEALMRWPTGLSGFERPETAWIQWQQQQLSFLSAIFSQPEAAQMDLF